MRVFTSFDLRSNLWLTRGILVILAQRGTSGAPMPKQVVAHHSRCSLSPIKRKTIFLEFSRSGMQIEGKQNMVSIVVVKKWRPYLLGRPFVIKTDHQSLKYLLEQRVGTPAQ